MNIPACYRIPDSATGAELFRFCYLGTDRP